jgi:hypothetical protein
MLPRVSRREETIPGVSTSRLLLSIGLGLAIGLVAAGPVTGSAGEPTAVASKKKKCKKALHKCAPKRYHLSVTDTVGPGPQSPGLAENWTAEIDLVRVARSIGKVDYGTAGGTVTISSTRPAICPNGDPGTIRVEPQTLAVPPGPGYPFLGDFGVEFSLIGSDKNTYGGPLGTLGSGSSNMFGTAHEVCPEGTTSFTFNFKGPLNGMEGKGKVGKVLSGSGVDSRLFEHHSYRWTLTPGGGKK